MWECLSRSIKYRKSSWIIIPQRDGWTTWASWWMATAAKWEPYGILVICFNILDIPAWNAFIIWIYPKSHWNTGKLQSKGFSRGAWQGPGANYKCGEDKFKNKHSVRSRRMMPSLTIYSVCACVCEWAREIHNLTSHTLNEYDALIHLK